MGWEGLPFLPYTAKSSKSIDDCYSIILPQINAQIIKEIQTREAQVPLQNLLADSKGRENFIRRYVFPPCRNPGLAYLLRMHRRFSTAIIMRVAYGHQITSDDDPYVKIAHDTGYALSNAGSPGSTPVDFIPFRVYFHQKLVHKTSFDLSVHYSSVFPFLVSWGIPCWLRQEQQVGNCRVAQLSL
jgi:hypothetical protein